MTAKHVLHEVESGDHSLQLLKGFIKKSGVTQEHSDETVLKAIRHFVEQNLKSDAATTTTTN